MYRAGSLKHRIIAIMSAMPNDVFTIGELIIYLKLTGGSFTRRTVLQRLGEMVSDDRIARKKRGQYIFAGDGIVYNLYEEQ